MQYFNIQVASQLSGVASATIRAWEKRYNAVVPERADNKHRLYSEKDIEKLALLFKLTEIGQSIGKIAHLELEELKLVFTNLMHRPYDELQLVTPHHEKIEYDKILNNFQIALSAYKLDIISHEMEKARTLLSPRDLCLNVLVPLFQAIGTKVSHGELSIAQEHTLSAIVGFHVGQMIGQHYQKKQVKEDLILISTPEGELHEIGILASALLCVHHSIKFIFMGPNMPAESLAQAANALKCRAILLGTTRSEINERQSLVSYLQDLSTKLQVGSEIWVGGNLKPSTREELDKRKISFFPSLEALDDCLSRY
ncbi:MerR family transcriptional regulator [Peredibacter starrii]|uniref:MerR family transcriptional regulator n=1 Tax=Peredibacter starrii TaxID=28202 RepID=A0AAX4HMR0_9BACT|nr:MerR family transcriptional regulator [Peredibacter starrii]WPU64501.1 MerR family transcriptional regulator [Peredibacter starrii]